MTQSSFGDSLRTCQRVALGSRARQRQTLSVEFDLEQTDALLSTTRAVRKRLDFNREVPDDVLLECLQLAIQAPTGSNRQGWRWMVVRDAEKKEALAEI